MENPYEKSFYAGWGDMDYNSHLRNTAYLDKSGDARMKIGPVILKDEMEYFREVNLLNEMKGTLAVAGLSADGSRWLMRNEFFRPAGKLAARVSSVGVVGSIDQEACARPLEAAGGPEVAAPNP
jgi:acyl-CoA thioester hydrolase